MEIQFHFEGNALYESGFEEVRSQYQRMHARTSLPETSAKFWHGRYSIAFEAQHNASTERTGSPAAPVIDLDHRPSKQLKNTAADKDNEYPQSAFFVQREAQATEGVMNITESAEDDASGFTIRRYGCPWSSMKICSQCSNGKITILKEFFKAQRRLERVAFERVVCSKDHEEEKICLHLQQPKLKTEAGGLAGFRVSPKWLIMPGTGRSTSGWWSWFSSEGPQILASFFSWEDPTQQPVHWKSDGPTAHQVHWWCLICCEMKNQLIKPTRDREVSWHKWSN